MVKTTNSWTCYSSMNMFMISTVSIFEKVSWPITAATNSWALTKPSLLLSISPNAVVAMSSLLAL